MSEQLTAQVRDFWEQQSCGTNAARAEKHTPAYYAEIEQHRYAVEPFIHQFAQFTRWHRKTILEVGVGAGTDFEQWCRAGCRASGVDLTHEAIENVEHRLALAGLSADRLQRANAERLPFSDATFDLVYSWGVIHHAANTKAVLREIVRVTKPGGTVKLMVYNRRSFAAWMLWLRFGLRHGKGRDWSAWHHQESPGTKLYSTRDLRRMLRDLPHTDLHFELWEQRIRRGARFERVRRVIHALLPPWARWYLTVTFVVTAESTR